jgi:uncharacterized protein YdhG (YjbR/CyaY superfamily)
MRQVKSTRGTRAATHKDARAGVEAYLAKVPKPSRPAFDKLRAAIRSAVPRVAVETISYRIPAFKDDVVLVWFAAFANHCSLFPTASVIAKFKAELRDYSTSKGTIHFALDQPIPVALVKRIVKTRVAEVAGKERR